MYKVTMSNLGGNRMTVTATTEAEPDYVFLFGMARKGLVSSTIEFAIQDDITDDEPEKVCGVVIVGGFRPVGSFVVEKVPEEAEVSNV